MDLSGRKSEESFMDTKRKSSAEEDEVFCQPCSSEGDCMVAVGYCEYCNEYMCANCLKVHRKQAMSRHHNILEGENMPKEEGSSVVLNACSELCAKHKNEVVKFFCSAHDVVGCGDCIVTHHKTCKVDHIQDISTSYFDGAEHQILQQNVEQFLKNIEQINREIKTSGKTLQQAYMKAENDIKAFKKEITDFLDKAEADILAELKKRKLSSEKRMSDLQEHENTMKDDIQELHDKLQLQLNKANKLFVAAKEMKYRITRIGDSIKQLQQDCQFKKYDFVCSKHVKEMFASKFKLGELLVKGTLTGKTIEDKTSVDKKVIAEMEPHIDGKIAIKHQMIWLIVLLMFVLLFHSVL
ncbi:E3 ubiquitin-protein ligase TRIM33-like [Mercenaria mercenaria]|uniref:E3 ubiquitin-protein ligase TRIM33-like n=1 Tax=Mercenaria mercenaria TaxID=6596 RepID=UPI00234EBDF4|nr:E3 ubiquitin-protein ligase TRIM33-like [Mercenaria mercenaria]